MRIGTGVPDAGGAARLEMAGLVLLYGFTIAAVTGYALFGRDPALLRMLPGGVAAFYGWSFGFFAQGHVWLAMAVLAAILVRYAGARWLGALAAIYIITLAAELAGTTWGLPFGAYEYGALLGPKWFDRVPIIIPLSWFFMAVPSYALASRSVRGRTSRILTASLVLLAWDAALDPAMSHATSYWRWADGGAYYGMPWLNLFGWYITGVALMAALWRLGAERWTSRIAPRTWVAFYGANLLLPLGMCAAAGLWAAVFVTLLLLAVLATALLASRRAHTTALVEPAR